MARKKYCRSLSERLHYVSSGVQFDVRKLQLGDFLWVAREKTVPTPGTVPSDHTLMYGRIVDKYASHKASLFIHISYIKINEFNDFAFFQYLST